MEEKKERKTANNNEVCHICVGTRQKETHWKLFNNTGYGEKGEEMQWGGYTDLGTVHVQA
jgi:hypothetical protein